MLPDFELPGFIQDNDPDTIHARMLEELPADMDPMPGGFAWDFTRPTALEKSMLIQFHLVRTLMLMFPMWAWDEYLDYHATIAGIERKAAGYASGTLTVIGVEGTQIPLGSIFVTPSIAANPSIEFKTTEACVIDSEGVIEVSIISVYPGTNSNVAAKTVTLMSKPINGITSVYNENPITGGTEQEDDESLRIRIQEVNESSSSSFVGNDSDYIRWAKEIVGVGSVVVVPEWDGSGTVKLVILDANGAPANDTIIQSVYNHIMSPDNRLERKAPIGAILTVTAPGLIEISYRSNIILSAGYDIETVTEAFKTNVLAYYETAQSEGVLRYTKLCSVLSNTDGISDFSNFLVNGGTGNIALEQDEYPQTISVAFEVL